MSHTESVKRYREKQKEQGKCVCCSNKAVKDKHYCQEHLEYYREYNKKYKNKILYKVVTSDKKQNRTQLC